MPKDTEIPTELSQSSLDRRRKKSKQKGRHFLKGPIPLSWLCVAANLPGKCLALALAIKFKVDVTRSETVTLGGNLCKRFGIGRKAKYRCLQQLESGGLIRVDRRKGRSAKITLLNFHPEEKTHAD